MNEDRLAFLADVRLPGDARILGLFLLELGEGWHHVSHSDFRAILSDGPADETLRRHLRRLEAAGWIEVDHDTGRKPPRYRIRSPDETRAGLLRDALPHSLPLISVGHRCMPHTHEGERDVSPTPERGIEPYAPHRRGAKPPVVVRSTKKVDVGVEETRASSKPTLHPLDERVDELLTDRSDDLVGCRGAFRDYLQARVPTDRQYGYVQTLATWLDGADPSVFRTPDGTRAPPGDVPGILATAFNELLASDEASMKRPVGDPANIRTKINVLLKQRARRDDHQSRSRTKEPRNSKPSPAPVSDIRGRRGAASE